MRPIFVGDLFCATPVKSFVKASAEMQAAPSLYFGENDRIVQGVWEAGA